MDTQDQTHNPPERSMNYAIASVTFGREVVDAVVYTQEFADKYPELAAALQTSDLRLRGAVVLPGEVVEEIVNHPEGPYDYYADPDGVRVYSYERGKNIPYTWLQEPGVRKISNSEALREYGAWALFKADDSGIGFKGQ